MKKTIARILAALFPALTPAYAFAYTQTLADAARLAVYYFNIAIELIIGLAIVVFVFNIYRYFFLNKENKERGMYLLWSVIGFFVIIGFWGLVNLIANTFNLNTYAPSGFGSFFSGSSGAQLSPSNGGNTGAQLSPSNGGNTGTRLSPSNGGNTGSSPKPSNESYFNDPGLNSFYGTNSFPGSF